MVNLPESLFSDPKQGGSAMSNGGATSANNSGTSDGASRIIDWPSASVDELLLLIREPQHREKAISFLTHIKKQGTSQDLALQIWHSISTVFLLLSEVTSIYKSLEPDKLTMKDSSKVCDVLALFECLATHPQTKLQFLNVQLHCYLYPFLKTVETSKPFQYLRLMSLGVIGGLLKEVGDPMAKVSVHCLLESGLFPLCLRSIEYGNDLSQSTASWIVSRIIMQEQGLQYCCEPATRLCAIMRVFKGAIEKMHDKPSGSVLKNIIQCYYILSDEPRGCLLMRSFIPPILATAPFIDALRERPITLRNLQELFQRLAKGRGQNAEAVGDVAGSSNLER
ncbi:hypothetical protein POM88_005981 [Heracleum sosnowskyi]|uniref:Cell differentiation protein rcd1 n=1 Tax=Heracleum sosnowskyi TaxID=360622 RepID=A0AAD8J3X9_9APIA|nr:hypothetical protein POM88_005981 [Heracleum sosnowskyi]